MINGFYSNIKISVPSGEWSEYNLDEILTDNRIPSHLKPLMLRNIASTLFQKMESISSVGKPNIDFTQVFCFLVHKARSKENKDGEMLDYIVNTLAGDWIHQVSIGVVDFERYQSDPSLVVEEIFDAAIERDKKNYGIWEEYFLDLYEN